VPGVQQGSTNFLISALEIQYPEAEILTKGWFSWLLTSVGMLFASKSPSHPTFSRTLSQPHFLFGSTFLTTLCGFLQWPPIS
jgi:hypothetical protein